MVYNPKKMDHLQFNRQYRDDLDENFEGIKDEIIEINKQNETMDARLTSVILNPTGGGNPEVVAARMSREGEEHPSLFAHLTAMEKDILDDKVNIQALMEYQERLQMKINIDEAEDKYYYVDGNWGWDENVGNTSFAPFKTIQKALDMIPQSTTGGAVTIFITDDVYEEDLVLRNKQGSDIRIVGNQEVPTNVKINSFYAVNIDAYLNISGIEATTAITNGFLYDRCSYVNTNNCVVQVNKKASGLNGILYSASRGVISGCTVSNNVNGIIANFNSQITVESNNTGTGNTNGITSARSTIHKSGSHTVTGTTKNEHYYSGGQIVSGGIV
ncbi:hypothetical protein Q8G35_12470 [Peribacillus simplex]|uniref:Uncharacterized protein n=2 Tax=Peribacillus TaxID=2675229 RepID=A0AA90P2P4_9BACI|nr:MULTISPECIES: hypothetical protein [Peribacillus]MDP1419225.1 hypothetical protein [Peribacillus simplex]MDP1452137.1 hypothetical protein [Peribacillus frigoritolerans]